MPDLADQVVDAWRIHARIQLYVLDALPSEALATDGGLGGRTVGQQFAHLHDVRLMWLSSAAPGLLEGLSKLGKEGGGNHVTLRHSLDASATSVERLLVSALDRGRVRGFKPHPAAFVGYLISHESYHQGDIGVRLTQAGHRLDNRIAYGMWEWGSR